MEFVLVLWTNKKPATFSIIPETEIRICDKNKYKAKYGSHWYNVKILKKSADKKWLESLDVFTDGTLYQPIPTVETLSIDTQSIDQEERINLRQKEVEEDADQVEKLGDLEYQVSGLQIEDKMDAADKNQDNNFVSEIGVPQEFLEQDIRQDLADRRADHDHSLVENQVVNEVINNKTFNSIQIRGGSVEKNLNLPKAVYQIELVEGRDLWINKVDLDDIVDRSVKPSDLTRKLLAHFVGEEELKTMSVSGKGGWKPVPQNILKTVKSFVKEKSGENNVGGFNRWVTKYCNRLRATEYPLEESAYPQQE
ncbi:hypothetical protein KQX54_011437 [Cotesia glomerata]|uniref:BEN domain-containing protein n=1 Tax=Cotesia glomerata TaxID=32391 RepID=A0AAV7IY95_COTGL|nr:hypothetical protein KQX54_011437 [Cotesia glomerata]